MEKRLAVVAGILILLAPLAVLGLPRIDKALFPANQAPGPITIFGVGLVFTALTVIILINYTREKNMGKAFLFAAISYNILLVITRFISSPLSLYEANKFKTFDCTIWDSPILIGIIAIYVFMLYFAVFLLFYLFSRNIVSAKIGPQDIKPLFSLKIPAFIGIALLAMLILGGGSMVLILVFFPLLDYLRIIFSTLMGAAIALALLGAVLFLKAAFKEAAEQAIAIRDAGVLAGFFWLGAGLLVLYSSMWLVYILTVIAIWPLKTVCPK